MSTQTQKKATRKKAARKPTRKKAVRKKTTSQKAAPPPADPTGPVAETVPVEPIRFTPNPIQRAFILSQAQADLFSSRFGEGKSAGLAWACFYHAQKNPGSKWAFVRDTWENLRDTTQKEFFSWFQPGVHGTYHASSKTWRWKVGEMRGEVQWLGMDEEKDASKLQSRDLGGFAIDEPAPAAHSGGVAEFIFTTAMGRLRQKGMSWYAAKLATNNPDETHWTYKRFVEPGTRGFRLWQPSEPENTEHLPPEYYDKLRELYKDRPDLVDRFIDGKFGFQRLGRSVTPAWNDRVHLVRRLEPSKGEMLHIGWDFGVAGHATVITDFAGGHWRVLEAIVSKDMGIVEHIEQSVRPLLASRYKDFVWDHVHDPANQRSQVRAEWTPVNAIRELLGGPCYPGAVDIAARVDSLNAALAQLRDGRGLVQVDRHRASPVWWALRGGWHFPISAGGVISEHPKKNEHSHPGDAIGYLASRFFPMGRLRGRKSARAARRPLRYFGEQGLGFEKPGAKMPKEGKVLPDPKNKRERWR